MTRTHTLKCFIFLFEKTKFLLENYKLINIMKF